MNESIRTATIGILYGKSGMELRLPPDAKATLIGKRPLAKLADPRAAVRDALAQPIGAPAVCRRSCAAAGARAS